MTEHRNVVCPLEEVECSNKCGKILQRQYLDSPKFPLPCPNNCDSELTVN